MKDHLCKQSTNQGPIMQSILCFSYRVRHLASVQSLVRVANAYYLRSWM